LVGRSKARCRSSWKNRYNDGSFLPHGTVREADPSAQLILLTTADHNPNRATVRFLIEGAAMPADASSYERIVLIFDGEDEDAVAAARAHWSECRTKGFDVTYWQTDDEGRWVKQA
jgi:DNA polymerase III subunit chi